MAHADADVPLTQPRGRLSGQRSLRIARVERGFDCAAVRAHDRRVALGTRTDGAGRRHGVSRGRGMDRRRCRAQAPGVTTQAVRLGIPRGRCVGRAGRDERERNLSHDADAAQERLALAHGAPRRRGQSGGPRSGRTCGCGRDASAREGSRACGARALGVCPLGLGALVTPAQTPSTPLALAAGRRARATPRGHREREAARGRLDPGDPPRGGLVRDLPPAWPPRLRGARARAFARRRAARRQRARGPRTRRSSRHVVGHARRRARGPRPLARA